MNINEFNQALAAGNINQKNLFPHLDELKSLPFVFKMDFGLDELPVAPGIILIRGARQYGKSTWLEQQLKQSIKSFGAGCAFYLNGDFIADDKELEQKILELVAAFHSDTKVKRIFIDEITNIRDWELCLKRLADLGKIKNVLLITTGSKATDLRRGAERLPGRKGKIDRTNFLFTPVSYKEFMRVCGKNLSADPLLTYMLSGGSPIACAELAQTGVIPEYVISLVRDWVEGEIALSGRSRASLINIMRTLFRYGGSAIGQAKLAREAGLANNSVAASYIELLNDLGCVIPSYPWDPQRKLQILRKPCKYHFSNLLVAVAFGNDNLRSVADFTSLAPTVQAQWYEWLISQELMRRSAINNQYILEPQSFWQNKEHEIDFVTADEQYIEVKRGKSSALDFCWFGKQFPKKKLLLLNNNKFVTEQVTALTMTEFLSEQ